MHLWGLLNPLFCTTGPVSTECCFYFVGDFPLATVLAISLGFTFSANVHFTVIFGGLQNEHFINYFCIFTCVLILYIFPHTQISTLSSAHTAISTQKHYFHVSEMEVESFQSVLSNKE